MLTFRIPEIDKGTPSQLAHHRTVWGELSWVAVAAATGFMVSAVGAAWLRLPRAQLVLILGVAVGMLGAGYAHSHQLQVKELVRQRWIWATIRGLLLGAVLILLALPDDSSAPAHGPRLVFDVAWLGVVYGIFDALLLNVLPMTACWRLATDLGWASTVTGRMKGGMLTVAANLFVTTSYHLGYPEFRTPQELSGPLTGNLLIAIGYVLTPNPITSVVGHIILHVATVLSGSDGPVQLPPHY